MKNSSCPTWIEVNLSAIEQNTRYVQSRINVPIMAVVKDNAYEHGAVEVSRAVLAGGAIWLTVARYCEARVLREAGIDAPILVLGMTTPDEVDEAICNNVSLCMYSYEIAQMFAERGQAAGKPVLAHLKIDTGMGRLGVLYSDALEFAKFVISLDGVSVEGLFSHFSMAGHKDHPHTSLQIKRFKEVVQTLANIDIRPPWIHLCNSSGLTAHPDARFNLVRTGTALLSMKPTISNEFPEIRRVITWKAKLASCKIIPSGWGIGYDQIYTTTSDEIIGALPVGYGDGFRRLPGNEVLIDGQRVPVVGRLCIDQCMVRFPKMYPIGTEVVILGTQGKETIRVEDLSKRWNTTEVDVTTGFSRRIPRIYIRD